MNVYITLHSDVFLRQQLSAIKRVMPQAVVRIVATHNASRAVAQAADIRLQEIQTAGLVPALLPLVAPGPGCVLEWDMVPVRPIAPQNAINVEPSAMGLYPSAMSWADSSELNIEYRVWQSLPFSSESFIEWHHETPAPACASANHFVLIGGTILHFHHLAGGKRPAGVTPERRTCWDSVMAHYLTPGLGDRIASALAAVGITKERVSKAIGKDCGCAKRQQQLNELGRRIGVG